MKPKVALTVLFLLALTTVALAETFDLPQPRIVNGTLSSLYPTTGALLTPGNPAYASLTCSGTLIGCDTFLTAAHCVCEGDGPDCQPPHAPNPAQFVVFLQHAGFFAVSSVAVRSDYNFPVGDVAILKLATPVNGIAPTPLNDTMSPDPGTEGTIAGFGRSGGGGGNADYGLKRVGKVSTASCAPGQSDVTSVCWNFTSPVGPPGTDSNSCNGDSGGPLFVDFGNGDVVAGVTSGGDSATCLPTDHSYDANVFTYASWLQQQGGADLGNTTCGALPQVGDPGTVVTTATGILSTSVTQSTHSFSVEAGTDVLRVAMNAVDDGSDFDLYVQSGTPPTTATFACAAAGPNQFGFCEFANPAPGTWYVLVKRYSGSGTYQVTATTFGDRCASPGTEGLDCDDGNACTSGDVCSGGTCTGALANGASCNDGNLCTINDVCTDGLCAGVAMPEPTCRVPAVPHKSLFQLNEYGIDTKDRVLWKWRNGAVTPKSAFGDPLGVNGTRYALCVYDAAPSLIMTAAIPSGGNCDALHPRPCWKATSKGFNYSDKDLTPAGIQSLTLREGLTAGKSSIQIKGKGALLDVPAVPIAALPVTVQLKNSNGECWQSSHPAPVTTNTTRGFKSRSN